MHGSISRRTPSGSFPAGMQYHPPAVKGLKLGVQYRSKAKIDFKGEADIDIADPFRDQLPPDGDASSTVTLPQAVSGGVAFSPLKGFEIEANVVWINWAQTFSTNRAARQTSLVINLPGGTFGVCPVLREHVPFARLDTSEQNRSSIASASL